MTIRAIAFSDVLTMRPTAARDFAWGEQLTVRSIADALVPCEPGVARFAIVNGHRVADCDWERTLADGAQVHVGIAQEGLFEVAIIVSLALLGVAAGFLASKLSSLPTDVGSTDERGDESSAARSWDGVRTDYQQGQVVPFVFGRRDVGGTAVHTDLFSGAGGTNVGPAEELRIILLLCRGPVYSVGGITEPGDDLGATEFQPWLTGQPTTTLPIPSDVRVNDNRLDASRVPVLTPQQGNPSQLLWTNTPNVRAYVRLGTLRQSPFPARGPRWGFGAFASTRQTDLVNGDLTAKDTAVVSTITSTDRIDDATVILDFPAGLYDLSSGASAPAPASVGISIEWRRTSETNWRSGPLRTITEAQQGSFGQSIGFVVGVEGPIEVRVTRTTSPGGSGVSDRCRWRQLVHGLGQRFSYNLRAALGLVLVAGDGATGARPNFAVPIEGLLLRVWDATIGGGLPSSWSYYATPSGSDPYAGIWHYPPGRNPAWIIVAVLTHKAALGRKIDDSMIDWQAFRDLADYCDVDAPVSGGYEALYQAGVVWDKPQRGLDAVAQLLQACSARLVMRGRRISVVYAYSSSHGRGSNSVPARTRSFLLTTANCTEFALTVLPNRRRPTVYRATFDDQDADFARAQLFVRDPLEETDDPTTYDPLDVEVQDVRFDAVTRESQVLRLTRWQHRVARMMRSEIDAVVAPEWLACDVGDVVGVVHDVLRPYSTACFSMRTTAASSAAASIALDMPLVLASGRTYVVVVQQDDATVIERTVTSAAGSYAAGATLTLSGSVTCKRGAIACIGEQDAVTVDYEVASITVAQQLRRRVHLVEYTPDAHVVEDVTDFLRESAGGLAPNALVGSDDQTGEECTGIRCRRLPGRGMHRVSWTRPDERGGAPCRVWARLQGALSWFMLGETIGSSVDAQLAVGATYEVGISMRNRAGQFQAPGSGATATVTAEEFSPARPANVGKVRLDVEQDALAVSWPAVDGAVAYEVRRAAAGRWKGAQVLARTVDTRARILLPSYDTAGVAITLAVCAFDVEGKRSARPALVTWTPAAWPTKFEITNNALTGGVAVNCSVAIVSGRAQITTPISTSSNGAASYAANSIDLGYDVAAVLSVGYDGLVTFTTPPSEANFPADSGEAAWWDIDGRPASEFNPGHDPELTVSSIAALPLDQLEGLRCGTRDGQPGTRAAIFLEYRTARTGESITSSSWLPMPGAVAVVARYVQIRFRFYVQNDGRTSIRVDSPLLRVLA